MKFRITTICPTGIRMVGTTTFSFEEGERSVNQLNKRWPELSHSLIPEDSLSVKEILIIILIISMLIYSFGFIGVTKTLESFAIGFGIGWGWDKLKSIKEKRKMIKILGLTAVFGIETSLVLQETGNLLTAGIAGIVVMILTLTALSLLQTRLMEID